MWTEDYRWHYDYVRLAWDTGFSFEKYKYPNLDKNKICLVDVDRVIKERDVASVERFVPTVVQYILESDQAEVLDSNFVKLFHMSQLSVEYLLFCKRYLDNTVVLLKKELSKAKEENKELKLFTQELENHISALTKQNNLVTTFKCEKCSKVFSTEEYLNSHVKRRHSGENKLSSNCETDMLQSEIKQLKERLNVTEKLLQEKDEKIEKTKLDVSIDESKIKVDEIQEKFEKFREKVENDIKILQIQKNFYEDKYSKLFDIVIQANNKENVSPNIAYQKPETVVVGRHSTENIADKTENTTQTDKGSRVNQELQIETVHDKNVYDFKDVNCSSESLSEKKENVDDMIEQKILKFEENIEAKISSSLNNIESQMQAFWGKLSELELKREKNLSVQQNVTQQTTETDVEIPKLETEISKPPLKPRTKLGKPTKLHNDNQENAKKIKLELEKMYTKVEPKKVIAAKTGQRKESQLKLAESLPSVMIDNNSITSDSDLESKSGSSVAKTLPENIYQSKPSVSTLGTWSVTSMRKAARNKEVIEKNRDEINNIVNSRLQEIGISSNWQGIPEKTFEKALAIIRHQADLTKKSYPDFDSIRKSIEKSLKNQNDLSKKTKMTSKTSISPGKQQPSAKASKTSMSPNKQQSVINISYRKKTKDIEPELELQPSTITIKNRSLYDDTESDSVQLKQSSLQNAESAPAYSAVIEELKSAQKKSGDTDSDLNSIILPEDVTKDNTEPQTKSALKNYPSMGSLTKKKVLFDIDTTESKAEDEPVPETGGSVTTAALERQIPAQREKDKDKKDDSLSDFDLSEY